MSDPSPPPPGDPELCSPGDEATTDARSLLGELGLRVDRDYRVPIRIWETALTIALSGERNSHGR
ncbi:hypothetical protein GCM10007298_00150 [Williamsia phyllosphaerae]|uniref:Uncharacterized protein n=1 Tax=Williamsia phyllosphaerae TaxID=885042 RepID=A0ABQ1U0I5_9NOCA|nr:hypothetical protein GCM10007298_00150 [Williamsia phyllosphaerae]